MILLLLGLILWWLSHLAKIMAPRRRADAVARMGEGPWKVLIALVTLLAIALMVIGYGRAVPVDLWDPPQWLWHLNNLLMIIAVVVFIAGFFGSPVRRRIRNPQLVGVKIWAVAHLLVNGDLASVVLFGGLLAWAVLAGIGTKRRDGPRGHLPDSSAGGLVAHLIVSAVLIAVIIAVHTWLGHPPFPG